MPEYLAPGVFVEEVSYRAKSIEGVGTSVAGLVGPTRTGPLRGKPELLTSFADFVRVYGDARPLTFGSTEVANYTAIAAKAFFDGGGSKLFVARIVDGVNDTAADGTGSSAVSASRADTNADVAFSSRFPGSQGNYTLELHWRDSENLLLQQVVTEPQENEVLFLNATGLTSAVRSPDTDDTVVTDAHFPIGFRGLVRRQGNQYVIVDNRGVVTTGGTALTPADFKPNADPEGVLLADGLVSGGSTNVTFTRVSLKKPQLGQLQNGDFVTITLSDPVNLSAYTGGAWGNLKVLQGNLASNGTQFVLDGDGLNQGVGADLTFHLAALAGDSTAKKAVLLRSFDLDVLSVSNGREEPVYSYSNISIAPSGERSLGSVLAWAPGKRSDALTSPISAKVNATTGEEVLAALYSIFDNAGLNPPANSAKGVRYLIKLTGGTDGSAPDASDFEGEVDETNGSTGFAAFEDIEDIAIVLIPAAADIPGDTNGEKHHSITVAMEKHCNKMRYRVGIVDSRLDVTLSEVRDFRSHFDNSRLALYYPWVVTADPTTGASIKVPPAGFIAGVYANTDVQRGVHKAPANEIVTGALGFAQEINRFQQELLNPEGINCLRSFPGRGHRVWGGRTLGSDPEWKYINVRRYFLYLERSIEKSTQWIVFEPNGERLWANVRTTVEDFLYNEWFNGRLLGPTAKAAYFVRCDRSTMTQNDLDNGRLVCQIGVAPLKPAEFVVFRIGQKTADA